MEGLGLYVQILAAFESKVYILMVLNPTVLPALMTTFFHLHFKSSLELFPPPIKISDGRIKYLGPVLRHPPIMEYHISFDKSLRTISSLFGRGAPRVARTTAEACHKITHRTHPFLVH